MCDHGQYKVCSLNNLTLCVYVLVRIIALTTACS